MRLTPGSAKKNEPLRPPCRADRRGGALGASGVGGRHRQGRGHGRNAGALAPEVIERLVGAPDIVLEQVMRRPWPSSWAEQSMFSFQPELH
jgi:hypothetical protein